jgi:GT2 family glycosyltransferase
LAPQIIVVDGGSFDGCDKMIAAEFPEVEFIQSPNNIGFGRSNNLGFEYVKNEAVLLLNPDTELKPKSVQHLLNELQMLPNVGILGAKLLNPDGSLQTSCVQALLTPWNQALGSEFLMRFMPNSKLWGIGDAFRSKKPTAVEAVSGACMLLRSKVFRQIGGFRPEFFMYAEDVDLCARILKSGFFVYHVPAAEVIHYGGRCSDGQVSQFSTVMLRVAGETYMRLNHGYLVAVWYRILQILFAIVRLVLLFGIFGSCGKKRRVAVRASIKRSWYILRWALRAIPHRFYKSAGFQCALISLQQRKTEAA